MSNVKPSFILGGQTGNGNSFDGYIKNFMVYNNALSPTEVQSMNISENFGNSKISNDYIQIIMIIGLICYCIFFVKNSNKMLNNIILICSIFLLLYIITNN
jgi:hypothetical protein